MIDRSRRLRRQIPGAPGAWLVLAIAGACAATAAAAGEPAPMPEAQIEVFRLAPGQQESFIRDIALWDEVSAAGGQPPSPMYIHEDGAGWDVMLVKPFPATPITPGQQAAMDRKAAEMHLPTGPAYWVGIRKQMATHEETRALGPVTAARWLAALEAARAKQEAGPPAQSPAKPAADAKPAR
jgi:hypothetical protein